MDGNDTVLKDIEDDYNYSETEHYWKTGKLTTIYKTYLDVNEIIQSSKLPEESKDGESQSIKEETDGGPRSRVRTAGHSAQPPIDVSGNFSAHVLSQTVW